jgi:hypothetical protein
MAAQTNTGDRPAVADLLSVRRAMGGGLLWAFVMLLILGLWLKARDADFGVLLWGPVLLLALVALALAVWQFVGLGSGDASTAGATDALLKQRRLLAYALLAGGAVLLVLGLSVAWQHGLASFPEVSSMVVLALIAAGAGVSQLNRPGGGLTQERVLQAMVRGRPRVIAGLFAAAAVAAGLGVWQGFASGLTPEACGGVLLALLFAGVSLWQALTPPENATAQDMRLLILFTGGVGGLIVAVGAFWRTWLWWGEIFPAEVPMAQSEGVWRLWLLVYVELVALAILFGSLLLARVDIRQNAVMRRLLFGYNTFLTGLLVLATLVLLNVVVYATYPLSFEFTRTRGLYGLSDSSKNLLRSLKEDVHIYVLMSAGDPLYTEVRNLTDNLQAYTRRLQVTTISPDREAERYRRLVSKYPVVISEREMFGRDEDAVGRGVLIVYGPDVGAKAPHAFIPRRDLYEFKAEDPRDPRGKEVLLLKAEPALMTQLRLLVNREVKPRIYFTQGNDELDLENVSTSPVMQLDLRGGFQADTRGGAGLLMERLKKDNYEVHGLVWGAPPLKKGPTGDLMVYSQKKAGAPDEVPEDADVVIIAHPLVPFTKDRRAALERYMDHGGRDKKGGKLILLANSLPTRDGKFLDLNLEDLLRKYGVQLGQDFLMRVPRAANESPLEALATPPEGGRNKVAAEFSRSVFPVGLAGRRGRLARSVEPTAAPGAFDVEVMLEVGEKLNGPVWGETIVGALNNPYQYILNLEARGMLEAKQSKKPISVAVGAKDREGRPRLAVFGDSRFASNLFVRAEAPYYDFLTSTIEWLAERPENVGIRPKESGMFHVDREKAEQYAQRLVWLPLALILFMLVGLGLGMWVVRRR